MESRPPPQSHWAERQGRRPQPSVAFLKFTVAGIVVAVLLIVGTGAYNLVMTYNASTGRSEPGLPPVIAIPIVIIAMAFGVVAALRSRANG